MLAQAEMNQQWGSLAHLLVVVFLVGTTPALAHSRPNPPSWPPTVRVFGPEDGSDNISGVVRQAFRENGGKTPTNHGQWSSSRFAFLFRPGVYDVDVPVGYYTQVLGLGRNPDEVVFNSSRGIYCEESDNTTIFGSLATFWRGAENFRRRGSMLWATSQATPVRRAIIDGDLTLAEYSRGIGEGYSSGGFVGNVRIGGKMQALSQQQYCARNAELATGAIGGVWNMVFVGTMGAPGTHCGQDSHSVATLTVPVTPRIAEKPFISIDPSGKYYLHIPRVVHNRVGPDFSWGEVVGFEQVYVAVADDSSATINKRLEEGLHVVLTPGIYNLEGPLALNNHDQVLLGLGFPTLIAADGVPALRVGNVDGVRVAGILVDAGIGDRDTLLEWGDGSYKGNHQNPSLMHDVFVRVGGTNNPHIAQAGAKVMVRIASGHVIGDNLWLWRADHDISGIVESEMNPCDTGLVVTGGNVTMYGLAVEHTLKDLVQWSGDDGETYFYQSELPYDVTQAYGDAGYVGYRVTESVVSHKAYGVGVYHYFRDHKVSVQRGIAAPEWLANSFEAPLAVYLSGQGEMLNILNSRGGKTASDTVQAHWVCEKGIDVSPPTTTMTTTCTVTQTATSTTSTTRTTSATGTTTTTATHTITGTSTTVTTTSTKTSTTTKTTSASTTTTTTTTSTTSVTTTTTTQGTLWWLACSGQPNVGSLSFWALIVAAATMNIALVYLLVSFACCSRRRRPYNEEPQVPVSRLLSMLGSPQSSSPMSRLFGSGVSPGGFGGASPERSDVARTVSMDKAPNFARRSLEGQFFLPSSRGPDTPGRRNVCRLFSMSSIAESTYSMSPRGNALLSQWLTRSPDWLGSGFGSGLGSGLGGGLGSGIGSGNAA